VSNINYLGINENFPVAGQDNDTQTFRDNFDTIKTSLRYAKEEITNLETNAAKLNDDNDFDLNLVSNAVFLNNKEKLHRLGNVPLETATSNVVEIDFQNGSYQTMRLTGNVILEFTNMPGDPIFGDPPPSVGRIVLEISSDGTERFITFTTSGTTIIKKSVDFPTTLSVNTSTKMIEVWRHRADEIYVKFLGEFA